MFGAQKKKTIPSAAQALPGRDKALQDQPDFPSQHQVNGNPLVPPFGEDLSRIIFGLGCFWGAERKFWSLDGVYSTAVGYAAGHTPNPDYNEVCSGMTGHNEVVLVIYDAKILSFERLLKTFWESHNPTQGMQQGNDQGTQYRSGIYVQDDRQRKLAEASKQRFQQALQQVNGGDITTEILQAPTFYYAEGYHQQYLAKNPGGYCGLGGTGVSLPD